uniref:Uncharacterized protein n=1 Tax=Rhizophora mucronata TaxID=61149 RepID=A0A2P2P1N7_RHIMU
MENMTSILLMYFTLEIICLNKIMVKKMSGQIGQRRENCCLMMSLVPVLQVPRQELEVPYQEAQKESRVREKGKGRGITERFYLGMELIMLVGQYPMLRVKGNLKQNPSRKQLSYLFL